MTAKQTRIIMLLAAATILATAVPVSARNSSEPTGANEQEQTRAQILQQLHDDLDADAGRHLTAQQRDRIRASVDEAFAAGLPTEPLMAKIQEGLRKHARGAALEHSVQLMSQDLATAAATADAALATGIAPGQNGRNRAVRAMALAMWGGLDKSDLDYLVDQARQCRQNDHCGLAELSGAAETALALRGCGVDPQRAVDLAGQALRQGYSAAELRAMRTMTESLPGSGDHIHDMVRDMEACLGEGMGSGAMIQHMIQAGWMGQGGGQGMGGYGSPDTDPWGHGSGGSGQGGHGGHGGHGGGGGGNH